MSDQDAAGIITLSIPLPDSPLATVNVYALRNGPRLALVDCGWNTPEAHAALRDGLAAAGHSIAAIDHIVVTHLHPDHFGLAARLAEESGADVLMHRLDATYVGARYEDARRLIDEMEAWLAVNGVPPADLEPMAEASVQLLKRVGTRRPDVLLEGGETLYWGDRRLEVLWVPGHSEGMICLYDRERRILFSSDHVLPRISPHVGLHVQSAENPLGRYLDSLQLVRSLPVDLVLPGHGRPFHDLPRRIDEIVGHHEERCGQILELLAAGPRTGWELAARLTWKGSISGWDELAPFQRRMALTETLAHLDYLRCTGSVESGRDGDLIRYRRAENAPAVPAGSARSVSPVAPAADPAGD